MERKIPQREWTLLNDQRNDRKMFVGGLDFNTTSKNVANQKRKEAEIEKSNKERKRIFQDQDTQEALSDIVWEDLDGLPYEPFYPKRPAHNSKNLNNLAVICDRHKVNDRAGAAVANAVLQDYGIITGEDNDLVIDKNKLLQSQRFYQKNLSKEAVKTSNGIIALYFDGRKDKTRVLVKDHGRFHQETSTEEHYTILSEPGNKYLDYVTPSTGRAKDILWEIIDLSRDHVIELKIHKA